MNRRIFIWILTIIPFIPMAYTQEWIGTQFQLDTVVRLPESAIPQDLSHLRYTICDGILYYADTRAYQDPANGHTATLYAIRLDDYASVSYTLPFPKQALPKENPAQTFWVSDFWIANDTLTISVQDHILRYLKTTNNSFNFDTLWSGHNVKINYQYKGELHYLEEDHDFGYRWYKIDKTTGHRELVRELAYEVPHVVQAQPNRYLFRDDHYIYFLSTRYAQLQKYHLDGRWVESINFNLPDWHPFDDEYIKKSLSVPYGIERIQLTMREIYHYSYPKAVFPLGDSYLLFYTQYDTARSKSHLHYAIADHAGNCELFNLHDTTNQGFSSGRFPFNLFDRAADKARISWNGQLLELLLDDDVAWSGLSFQEYQQQRETFFRHHEPIPSIRVMTYRNSNPIDQPMFYDAKRHYLSLKNLPLGKNILLINNELECSGCRNALLNALNKTPDTISIGIVYAYEPGTLSQYELRKEIQKHLKRPFSLIFLENKRQQQYPRYISSVCNAYPSVLFYESGEVPIFYDLDKIFDQDPSSTSFSDIFKQQWNEFLAK